ncbi:MAG: hypothetical protein PUD44_01350 [Clostridiaceae bacterium]|nr:hypothetical protein [Clostridiaceae bacterium]
MRRLAFCLACLLLVSGCAASPVYPTDGAYHADTDHPYFMYTSSYNLILAPSDNGFYMHVPVCLLHIDPDCTSAAPVCARPNCLHEKETDPERFEQCSAYFPYANGVNFVAWYRGVLYGLFYEETGFGENRTTLKKISQDGSRREDVLCFGDVKVVNCALIHRGSLYISLTLYDENTDSSGGLYAYSLDRPDEPPETVIELSGTGTRVISINAYGNYLYYLCSDPYAWDDRVLYAHDLNTGETFPLPGAPEGYAVTSVDFLDGKLITSAYPKEGASDDAPRFFECGLDGSHPRELPLPGGTLGSDGRYLYLLCGPESPDGARLYVYDAAYGEVDCIGLAFDGFVPAILALYPTAGEYAILHCRERGSGKQHFYRLDKSALGSGTLRPAEFLRFDHEYMGALCRNG